MNRHTLLPLASVTLLGLHVDPALAWSKADQENFNRYAASGYEYCDAVILGLHWRLSPDQTKLEIGRNFATYNQTLVRDALNESRNNGNRCGFEDTGFSYEDAEAVAALWEIGVEDAKAALADKVSTGYRELAEQVIAEAYE